MKKIFSLYRRLRLGKQFKHQYNCHPDFNLQRADTHCIVLWKHKAVATIPYAHQFEFNAPNNCFIIASGPSLAEVDLQSLVGYDTISLNCAIKKFSDAQMIPTHCVIVDHRVFERQWDCVRASIISGAHCFFSYDGLSRICEREPALLNHGNIYLIESISRKFAVARLTLAQFHQAYDQHPDVFLERQTPTLARSVGFSCNLKEGVFSGKTVATWATQLAVALGYQQIFMIGMDLGGTGKKHFYSDGSNKAPDFMKDYEPYIRICFEQVQRASIARGFKLYNLSKESTLPDSIIPKISLEQALHLAKNMSYKNH